MANLFSVTNNPSPVLVSFAPYSTNLLPVFIAPIASLATVTPLPKNPSPLANGPKAINPKKTDSLVVGLYQSSKVKACTVALVALLIVTSVPSYKGRLIKYLVESGKLE